MQGTNRSGFKIVKVPMGPNDFVPNRPPAFPRQPSLYLELLENKNKIKQDLVNHDYKPKSHVNKVPFIVQDKPVVRDTSSPMSHKEGFSPGRPSKSNPKVDYPDNLSDFSDNDSDVGSPREEDNLSDMLDDLSDVEDGDVASRSEYSDDVSDVDSRDGYSHDTRKSPKADIARALGENEPVGSPGGAMGGNSQPPTLSQIEQGHGGNFIPDAGQPTSLTEEQEYQKKQDLLDKFYTLKQKYKGATDIPEFTVHSDLDTMQRSYDRTVRRLKIDSRIAWYSQMITYVFVGIEWFCSSIFKIDMSGYTQHQTLHKDSYESLLVELGERSYMPKNWNIPVELKLVGLILMNTALFIFSKMMMKKMGVNILSFNTSSTIPPSGGAKPAAPKTMKEPDFNLDDIP